MGLRMMPQEEVVAALAELAQRWRDPKDPFLHAAQSLTDPFPFSMTRVSLEALLDGLAPEALWAWIDAEGARDAQGPPLVGHVIAGNAPLLAWTSLIRALLMHSHSRVKLPSGGAAAWGRLFHDSLAAVSPALAASIEMEQWPGGTPGRSAAFCHDLNILLVYGSDGTIGAWRQVCPPETRLIAYGHRVSCGVALAGADWAQATAGLARDVLLYDQGGCLSPQTVFVEGSMQEVFGFSTALAEALQATVPLYSLPCRAPEAAARVRAARALARMEGAARLWEDAGLRWTVIARGERMFVPSPTHGVVSVQPLVSRAALADALTPLRDRLQGCAAAGPGAAKAMYAANLGFSYVCAPGVLQMPPLSWPQDNIPPLCSLCNPSYHRV